MNSVIPGATVSIIRQPAHLTWHGRVGIVGGGGGGTGGGGEGLPIVRWRVLRGGE